MGKKSKKEEKKEEKREKRAEKKAAKELKEVKPEIVAAISAAVAMMMPTGTRVRALRIRPAQPIGNIWALQARGGRR